MDLAEPLGVGEMEGARTPVKDVLEEARDFVERHNATETFAAGDLVVWKDGMRDRKFPEYGEPILVLETFPAERREDDGSQYDCQPSDMRCVVFKNDEGMQAFAYDSHRFTKYSG
jgi:hypothetical protein